MKKIKDRKKKNEGKEDREMKKANKTFFLVRSQRRKYSPERRIIYNQVYKVRKAFIILV